MDRDFTAEEIDSVAKEVLASLVPTPTKATVLALHGDLGAGKTTFTKALAKALNVAESVISPTFVVMKRYYCAGEKFTSLVHVDAYRLESISELAPLYWDHMLQEPETLIVVEWPEHIAEALPETAIHFSLAHVANGRHIKKL